MDKIFKHSRSGSFGTRARYQSSCTKFVQFLDQEFKMKNLRNLQDKHVAAFIEDRQGSGIAAKTLKNDLGAIRYLHDLIPNAKHELSSNEALKDNFKIELEKTPVIKGNRGWTDKEYKDMQQLAKETANNHGSEAKDARDVHDVMQLARTMGLRVTEAVAMSRSQAEQALRTDVYQVKNEGKNGKWRKVPFSNEARTLLKEKIKKIPRGQRVFVGGDEKTHQAVNRVEKFLYNNRDKIETEEGKEIRTWENNDGKNITNALTFHGLRYNYIQNRMENEMSQGFNKEQAASMVTNEVGHERTKVINVYLAGK